MTKQKMPGKIENLKRCNHCKKEKTLDNFSKYHLADDGYTPTCKSCINSYFKRYYQNKKSKVLKRQWEYHQSEAGRKMLREVSKRMYKKYPEKMKARYQVRRAVQTGKLTHLACEVCGNFLSEAHHPDYSRPLDVWWLCRKHHKLADRGELKLYI